MTTATLNLKVSPRRMLKPNEAAEYCGLKATTFPAQCGVPPIAMPGGTKLYDIRDLDAWIDQMKAGSNDADDVLLSRLDNGGAG